MRSFWVLCAIFLALVVAAPSAGHHRPWHPKPTLSLPPLTPTPVVSPTPSPTPSPTATPTAAPTPTGIATATASQTTGTCSQAVHDSYTALGPDGNTYPAWHPQRDPSGCYFRHEHGSNPAGFAANHDPAFGYINAVAGHSEPHVGFKNFLLDDGTGHHWLWTVHFGTAGIARICERFHSVDLAIAQKSTGQLLADIHFLADFGAARRSTTAAYLSPDACPNQEAIGPNGARSFTVVGDGNNYEPWRFNGNGDVFGLSVGGTAFNTTSAITFCADANCNSLSPSGNAAVGAFRIVHGAQTSLRLTPLNTGNFTTNIYGTALGGPVQQFIEGTAVQGQTAPNAYNYWPQNLEPMLYLLRSNDDPNRTVNQVTLNVDGQLSPPN